MSELEALLHKISKPAFSIRLSAGEPVRPTDSKFGGQPYFEHGGVWPVCSDCEQPEYFICQLDVRKCGETGLSDYYGLVSFFYCWKCFPWDPDQPGWSVINHPDPDDKKVVSLLMPPLSAQGFLAKLLRGQVEQTSPCSVEFFPFKCFPQMDEFEELCGADSTRLLGGDDAADQYYEMLERLSGRRDNYDTMIGGYAEWIQSMPDMLCKKCGSRLRLLMQIGSESKANLMFGDAGAIYLLFCESHPQDVIMVCQCF